VAHPQTGTVLGAHAAGESATELVHVGQMAIIAGLGFETFIDTVFNFPTFAEAYRVAAFDLLKQQRARTKHAAE
jgi:NAD(P) transhydrogenase